MVNAFHAGHDNAETRFKQTMEGWSEVVAADKAEREGLWIRYYECANPSCLKSGAKWSCAPDACINPPSSQAPPFFQIHTLNHRRPTLYDF